MILKTTACLFFLLTFCLFAADDIHFNSGNIFKNVEIMDSTESKIIVNTTYGIREIPKKTICKIIRKPFNPEIESEYVDSPVDELELIQSDDYAYDNTESYLKVKPIFLFNSALSFLVCWDFFKDANDINKTIEDLEELSNNIPNAEFDKSDLVAQRKRKKIIGFALAVSGIVNLFEPFDKVRVATYLKSINLSYEIWNKLEYLVNLKGHISSHRGLITPL